ncbi:hypothetical protein E2C01_085495 [Portunus trituberculatus]|uniref:Uncharacterized protein n=1 Tax=Portunus trituberculatus TaxID=210409 RepID=A0A5B7J916_PORTR|nr:hypothetical protein [Portunus trituberculatus]
MKARQCWSVSKVPEPLPRSRRLAGLVGLGRGEVFGKQVGEVEGCCSFVSVVATAATAPELCSERLCPDGLSAYSVR